MYYYRYELLLHEGGRLSGVIQTPQINRFVARSWIETRYHGIVVNLSLVPMWYGWAWLRVQRVLGGRAAEKDMIGLLRDLALMSTAGIPLLEAFTSCHDALDSRKRALKQCVREMIVALESGMPVDDAFARQSHVFPDTVRSLLVIGHETGALDRMLMEAAGHLERVSTMKADARQALIYPAFVFLAIFSAAAFWVYYVIPNLSGLFRQMNVKLPALTLSVMGFADWCRAYGMQIVFAGFAGGLAVMMAWRISPSFRVIVYKIFHRIPIVRRIMESAGLAFFSEYLHLLIAAGLDVVRSFDILERATTDLFYREKIAKMRGNIQRGDRISLAIKAVGGFPAMMGRVIAVGEQSGSLDRQLSYLAEEYRNRMNRMVGTISELIKPIVVFVAGGLFILVIIAFLLPVYDLIRHTMSIPA
ncbi:type II secretion system F family protein [Burkholderia gladioli]|uniref:type II secretion system F family protein n=1 Tax=Burkholderia gladioli TaxID=28095 RepID=UPI0016421F9F|nr:type II secretion system F family protein [Burkholderia gladioli]